MKDAIAFPIEAVCEKQMIQSPLRVGEQVTAINLAKINDCNERIMIIIKWQDREFAVPLEQLKPIDAGADFCDAVEDWKYWVSAGRFY